MSFETVLSDEVGITAITDSVMYNSATGLAFAIIFGSFLGLHAFLFLIRQVFWPEGTARNWITPLIYWLALLPAVIYQANMWSSNSYFQCDSLCNVEVFGNYFTYSAGPMFSGLLAVIFIHMGAGSIPNRPATSADKDDRTNAITKDWRTGLGAGLLFGGTLYAAFAMVGFGSINTVIDAPGSLEFLGILGCIFYVLNVLFQTAMVVMWCMRAVKKVPTPATELIVGGEWITNIGHLGTWLALMVLIILFAVGPTFSATNLITAYNFYLGAAILSLWPLVFATICEYVCNLPPIAWNGYNHLPATELAERNITKMIEDAVAAALTAANARTNAGAMGTRKSNIGV